MMKMGRSRHGTRFICGNKQETGDPSKRTRNGRRKFQAFVASFAVCAATICVSTYPDGGVAFAAAVSVATPSGLTRFDGSSEDEVDSFLGIKFATVVERFEPSVLMEYDYKNDDGAGSRDETKVVDAKSYGPWCHQYTSIPYYKEQSFSEDCLNLNIWRPSVGSSTTGDSSSKLPVMVWIHGGGFVMGSGGNKWYDGSHLARRENVIVVSINYRLGVLGYLVTREKNAEESHDSDDEEHGEHGSSYERKQHGSGGMNGIHDQIVALEWIQRHIETFGGDPNLVTLFGQSAGSISICVLNVSPLARGLFRRAIMESGECVLNSFSFTPPDDAEHELEDILEKTGATSIADLKDATQYSAAYIASLRFMTPAVDEWVAPLHPSNAYDSNPEDLLVPEDVIVGYNSFDDPNLCSSSSRFYVTEARHFTAELRKLGKHDSADDEERDLLQAYSPGKYRETHSGVGMPFVAVYAQHSGDDMFACPAREYAALIADRIVGKTYLYSFEHKAVTDPIYATGLVEDAKLESYSTWTSHGGEISFVFGTFVQYRTFQCMSDQVSEVDVALSNEIMHRWSTFARTGNPNPSDHAGSSSSESNVYAVWEPVSARHYPDEIADCDTIKPSPEVQATLQFMAGGGKMVSHPDDVVRRCSSQSDVVEHLRYLCELNESVQSQAKHHDHESSDDGNVSRGECHDSSGDCEPSSGHDDVHEDHDHDHDQDHNHDHDDHASSHDDHAPSHDDHASSHDDHASSHDDHASSHDDHASSHDDHASSHDDHASSHDDHASSHDDHASSHDDHASSHDDQASSHDHHASSYEDGHSSDDSDDGFAEEL